jgi:transcriptional regulator with XRE-family HTH domain
VNPSEITSIREALGLSQLQFAQLLGVHPVTVSKWERDLAAPTDYQAAFLSQFQAAVKNKIAGDELKNLLIVAGVIAALVFIFQNASKK